MKKIVVVVDEHVELFEEEKLVATTIGIPSEGQILEIYNGDKLLSQFSEWTYWRYTK